MNSNYHIKSYLLTRIDEMQQSVQSALSKTTSSRCFVQPIQRSRSTCGTNFLNRPNVPSTCSAGQGSRKTCQLGITYMVRSTLTRHPWHRQVQQSLSTRSRMTEGLERHMGSKAIISALPCTTTDAIGYGRSTPRPPALQTPWHGIPLPSGYPPPIQRNSSP